jgi:hypothetical protein
MKVETPKKTKATLESTLVRVFVDLAESTFHVVGLDAEGNKDPAPEIQSGKLQGVARPTGASQGHRGDGGVRRTPWWGDYCQSPGHTPTMIPPHHVRHYTT